MYRADLVLPSGVPPRFVGAPILLSCPSMVVPVVGSADADAVRLRVASYNIHRCVGSDGEHLPERVAEVLAEMDADVVGLQEVDSGFEPRFGVDQLAYLAQARGMECIEGPTLLGKNGHYGNGLLSRLPIRVVHRVDLSVRRRERRGALDVDIETAAGPLRVIVAHLGLRVRERRAQVRALARLLAARSRPPTVLLGDFNEWWPLGGALRRLEDLLGWSPRPRTFPARWPLFALDRIWVRPYDALESVRAHQSALATAASDHLPVLATVRCVRRRAGETHRAEERKVTQLPEARGGES